MNKFILGANGETLVNVNTSTYIRPNIWENSKGEKHYELYIYHGELKFQLATYNNKEDMITEFENIIEWLNQSKAVYKCQSNFISNTTPITTSSVDWTLVKPDTLVWVRNANDSKWRLRYFSHYDEKNEYYMCFCGGATSKTTEGAAPWKFAKLWSERGKNEE